MTTERADATWNPLLDRTGSRLVPEYLAAPLRWRRPRKIYVNSLSDLFHESVSFDFIATVFGVMACAHRHVFQVLTLRPSRAKAFFDWIEAEAPRGVPSDPWSPFWRSYHCQIIALRTEPTLARYNVDPGGFTWPLPNVWIGTSVGHETVKHRIEHLRELPAAVRFLSLEPLYGPLGDIDLTGIGWVVVGGETGPGARPMHPDWARSVRDHCVAQQVPFLFKQWGEWMDLGDAHELAESGHVRKEGLERIVNLAGGHGFHGDKPRTMRRVWKRAAGRILDGRTWDEFPPSRL